MVEYNGGSVGALGGLDTVCVALEAAAHLVTELALPVMAIRALREDGVLTNNLCVRVEGFLSKTFGHDGCARLFVLIGDFGVERCKQVDLRAGGLTCVIGGME